MNNLFHLSTPDLKFIFATFFIVLTFSAKSIGCDCAGKSTVAEEVENSEVVVAGKVVSSEIIPLNVAMNGKSRISLKILRVKLEINYVYKGEIQGKIIDLVTFRSLSTCGFPFETGQEYIVYGNTGTLLQSSTYINTEGNTSYIYETHLCSRTDIKNDQEIIEIKRVLNSR